LTQRSFPPYILTMSTLGLSGPPQQDEVLLKRLLWPSVRNSHDVDLLGQQGFWIAQIVALLSAISLIVTSHPILAVAAFLFYVLGGIGLREGSVAAAGLVFAAWLLDQIAAIATHSGGLGLIPLVVTAILLANLRGAVLVARWSKQPQSDAEDVGPMRFSETLVDKFRDQLPSKLWPSLRYVFYVFAVGFLTLELLGVSMLFLHPQLHRPATQTPPNATVSTS
jgi:hypothetical protein